MLVSPAYSGEITNHRAHERVEKIGPNTAKRVSTKRILCQKNGDPVCHKFITGSIFQPPFAHKQSWSMYVIFYKQLLWVLFP